MTVTLLAIAMASVSNTDLTAYCLWAEARGEGQPGIVAVASVISNRAKLSHKTFRQVILAKNQFSCMNGKTFLILPKQDKTFHLCQQIARKALKGGIRSKWTNYYAFRVCSPSWGNTMRNRTVVGNHVFGTI